MLNKKLIKVLTINMKQIRLIKITLLLLYSVIQVSSAAKVIESYMNYEGYMDDDITDNIGPIPIELGKLIEPFNDSMLYKDKELKGLEFYQEVGRVRVPGGTKPGFFPISFSLFSRKGALKDLQLDSLPHKVSVNGNHVIANYHFNLAHLKANSTLDLKRSRTIIIISGYRTEKLAPWTLGIKDKWLQLEDVNVILVHWDQGCFTTNYAKAAGSINLVARQAVILLYYLTQLEQINLFDEEFLNRISIVGHSLGAHIAGAIGEDLKGKLDRITGLDPAGVMFDLLSPEFRLSKDDAKLVDILHTNGGKMKFLKAGLGVVKNTAKNLLSRLYSYNNDVAVSVINQYGSEDKLPWFGIEEPIGHLDYYPNGGSIQAGCNDDLHLCDHGRATVLYTRGLEYEIQARKTYGKDSEIIRSKKHRLVAFPSADYEKFKSGTDLLRNCPQLVQSSRHLTNEDREENYRRCTIPLDFVSTGREFAYELKEIYGLRLGEEDQRRLYFDTLNKEPFLNEHLLLRINLDHTESLNKWQKGCRFTALLYSYTQLDTYSIVDYSLSSLSFVQEEKFHGLTLPFVSTNSWPYSFSGTNNLVHNDNNPFDCDDNCMDKLMLNLPYYIKVGMGYDSKTGTIKRVVSSLSNIFGFSGEEGKGNTCKLLIKSIEVKPLVSLTNLTAWFNKENNSGSMASLKSQSELIEQPEECSMLLDWKNQKETIHISKIGLPSLTSRK